MLSGRISQGLTHNIKAMRKHNHNQISMLYKSIASLVLIIMLAGYVTNIQARNIDKQQKDIKELQAQVFARDQRAYDYQQAQAIERARQEAKQKASHASREDAKQLLSLSDAEADIIEAESHYNVSALNASDHLGFGQLSTGNRKLYAKKLGYKADTLNPYEQVTMMRAYIADRYGNAEDALKFRLAQSPNWY